MSCSSAPATAIKSPAVRLPDYVTPLVLTYNEAPNIGRTLSKLDSAERILILDSFSTDETLHLARPFSQVEITQRAFDSFAGQCNFGLQHINTEWVLSLDADYVLSDELIREIQALQPSDDIAGYRVRFQYCVYGRALRGSLYPPRVVLYRKDKAKYINEGHGHRVQINGRIADLRGVIYHDDRKPLSRWLAAQQKYAAAEAATLLHAPRSTLSLADRIRTGIVFAPLLVFFYTLFGKGLILDGWPGWFYVLQRTYAELLLSLHLLDARLTAEHRTPTKPPTTDSYS